MTPAQKRLVVLRELVDALRVAEQFTNEELECRERSYLPETSGYVKDAQNALRVIRRAIARAERHT